MIIEYDLKVETEYHIGTGLEHPGVADRTIVTRSDKTLVIPGEHFRGILRDACIQVLYWLDRTDQCCNASLTKGPRQNDSSVLSTCGLTKNGTCVLCRLFGTTFTPRRYEFFDSTTDDQTKRVSMHNRMDPATGRAPEEMFFSFEVGAKTTFAGRIERDGPQINPNMLQEEIGLLLAGLRAVERVGSRSRRGWGRCRTEVKELTFAEKETPPGSVREAENISAKVDAWLKTYVESAGKQDAEVKK